MDQLIATNGYYWRGSVSDFRLLLSSWAGQRITLEQFLRSQLH